LENKGRLKIYLGYAVGVGKTFMMLSEAHELIANRVDVVSGYIEPHGRPATAEKMNGIETISPLNIHYRDIVLKEVDVASIIRRRPSTVLIDEFAHTNAPGSQNLKRHSDIEFLLDSGIDVNTTLNVQHIESIAPVIEKKLGIKVSERIPDSLISKAHQIINVDPEISELIERIIDGKIFKPEMIGQALHKFFTQENLNYLRNLTHSWLKENKNGKGLGFFSKLKEGFFRIN
jgi:two-component system, OmpR family, sensor histidine kinase KdpD